MGNHKSMLIILDGWGIGPDPTRSAIAQAKTPVVDGLLEKYPNATLLTHGENVGLPEGQMGNSEVGHINIGAGRIIYQELARINKAVKEKTLHKDEVLIGAIQKAKAKGGDIHLMGLLSDGGVHSHINHLLALSDIMIEQGVSASIHGFMDGRDTSPTAGLGYVKTLLNHIGGSNTKLATLVGRYYGMDRDNRWERIRKSYDLMVKGIGNKTDNVLSTLQASYDAGVTDEFIEPTIIEDTPEAKIKAGDLVIFFNFRTDRPRQITSVLTQEAIPEEDMVPLDIDMVTFTEYKESFKGIDVIFKKDKIANSMGEVLAAHGKTQMRIAETEKYPHVTFFFSGGREEPFEGEGRVLVPSPKVATYDLQPEMSAEGITDGLLKYVEEVEPDFVCLNFANTDMVGHTGVFSAGITAAETVDTFLGKILEECLPKGYHFIIIADHGNCDYMINDDGSPHTAHTTNPVPVIYVGEGVTKENTTLDDGILADVAPTILSILGVDKPTDMTGRDLIS